MRKLVWVVGVVALIFGFHRLVTQSERTWYQGHSPDKQVADMYYLQRPSWNGDKTPCTLYGMKDGGVRLWPADARQECLDRLRYLPDSVKNHFHSHYSYPM